MNHPQRRLAALSVLAHQWPAFRRYLSKRSVTGTKKFFEQIDHPFWNAHYTLTARSTGEPMALVGDSRATEILANVVFPFWSVEGLDIWSDYEKLPARLGNRRLETAAARLFGDDPRRRGFLQTVAHQQALLQIYEDFCLQDNSDCAHCPFPEQMKSW
jgi:hypothetical protein